MPTNDQPQSVDDVKAVVDEHGIRFIRFWFTDILGQLKSFAVNKEELDDAFEGGMCCGGRSSARARWASTPSTSGPSSSSSSSATTSRPRCSTAVATST